MSVFVLMALEQSSLHVTFPNWAWGLAWIVLTVQVLAILAKFKD